MLIALDYDGTYTTAPDLWLGFLESARSAGHQVWIVTMRDDFELEDVRRQLQGRVDRIVATCRCAKAPYLKAWHGVVPDIWIDDQPHFIHQDAAPRGLGAPGPLGWQE